MGAEEARRAGAGGKRDPPRRDLVRPDIELGDFGDHATVMSAKRARPSRRWNTLLAISQTRVTRAGRNAHAKARNRGDGRAEAL